MGGRGKRSALLKIYSSPAGFQKGILGTAVPATLREALGTRGEPMSIMDAYMHANPGYNPSYAEYSMNCQRSVIAYELRRRGYDVAALPTYEGDQLGRGAYQNSSGVRTGYWMGAFQGASPVSVAGANNKQVESNIASQMRSWGNGSRAIIQVRWQGTNQGHVFNVENVNGAIRAVDAQLGTSVNLGEWLSGSAASKTQLIRTDNLRVSERAKKSVGQRNSIYG